MAHREGMIREFRQKNDKPWIKLALFGEDDGPALSELKCQRCGSMQLAEFRSVLEFVGRLRGFESKHADCSGG